METNLPSCFSIEFLEQLLKFLENFTLLKCVKSERSYGFLITKELIFGFQILDLKYNFSAILKNKFTCLLEWSQRHVSFHEIWSQTCSFVCIDRNTFLHLITLLSNFFTTFLAVLLCQNNLTLCQKYHRFRLF